MNYYLLPVDKSESDKLEDALRKINYDVDHKVPFGVQKLLTKLQVK